MDSEEKLIALKKAYAEIILNTAKEAAAQIMVTERKSVRLEHELNVSKEHALQMLLRLKQMMDFNIIKAQTDSLSQQKKIDELEAQLQEAEEIVKELREELREVHNELDEAKNSISKEKKLEIKSIATVYMEKSALDQISEAYNTYQEDVDAIEGDNLVLPDTAPIPEEKKLDVELRGEVNNGNPENNFSHIGNLNISNINLPSIILRSKGSEPYRNRRTQRIRAFEEKLMAGELTFPNTINNVNDDANGNDNENDERICKLKGPIGAKMKPAVQKDLKRKRARLSRNKKNIIPTSGHLHMSCGELNSNNKDVEPDENPLDMLSRLSENIQECTLVKCTEISESDVLNTKIGLKNNCADVDKVGVPVVSSKEIVAGTDGDISKQNASYMPFKYTFQRRKKRSLSSSIPNASVENKIMEEEVKKNNESMEMENSTSVAGSSRDSRRMAQVARQLISLSEKKWWK